MKVAICYWGLTRSTKKVYQSHYNHLFNVLKNANIEFTTFMHTWKTQLPLIWDKAAPPIDYDEWKLLNPNEYQIDDQDEFLSTLNFLDYFDPVLYQTVGDSPSGEWIPALIRNHICALESLKRVYKMADLHSSSFDYLIAIRPDVELHDDFDINWIQSAVTPDILVPMDGPGEGYNDRFAILPFNKAHYYMCRIDLLVEYRKHNGRIVSEKFCKYAIDKYLPNITLITFMFTIIRP